MAALHTESKNNNNSNNTNAVEFIELTNVGVQGEKIPYQYQYYFSLWHSREQGFIYEKDRRCRHEACLVWKLNWRLVKRNTSSTKVPIHRPWPCALSSQLASIIFGWLKWHVKLKEILRWFKQTYMMCFSNYILTQYGNVLNLLCWIHKIILLGNKLWRHTDTNTQQNKINPILPKIIWDAVHFKKNKAAVKYVCFQKKKKKQLHYDYL